jgi:hypothetical protein
MMIEVLSGCGKSQPEQSVPADTTSSQTQQTKESTVPETVEPITIVDEEPPETVKAREMKLIPAAWEEDLSAEADFTGFQELMTSFIQLCDETALSAYQENVNAAAFRIEICGEMMRLSCCCLRRSLWVIPCIMPLNMVFA